MWPSGKLHPIGRTVCKRNCTKSPSSFAAYLLHRHSQRPHPLSNPPPPSITPPQPQTRLNLLAQNPTRDLRVCSTLHQPIQSRPILESRSQAKDITWQRRRIAAGIAYASWCCVMPKPTAPHATAAELARALVRFLENVVTLPNPVLTLQCSTSSNLAK